MSRRLAENRKPFDSTLTVMCMVNETTTQELLFVRLIIEVETHTSFNQPLNTVEVVGGMVDVVNRSTSQEFLLQGVKRPILSFKILYLRCIL